MASIEEAGMFDDWRVEIAEWVLAAAEERGDVLTIEERPDLVG